MKEKTKKPISKKLLNISILLLTLILGTILGYLYNQNKFVNEITVYGKSSVFQKNQLAKFNVGVTSLDQDKEIAVKNMEDRGQALVNAIKEYGIPTEDIKTLNVSVYQDQNWDPDTQRSIPGDWRAYTSYEIRVKDVQKVSGFTSLLATQDATDIYGPNFSYDDKTVDDTKLLSEALDDAKQKALAIANASGRKLGKMVSFTENTNYSGGPIMYGMGMEKTNVMGGAPVESGTSEVQTSVTVIYTLK